MDVTAIGIRRIEYRAIVFSYSAGLFRQPASKRTFSLAADSGIMPRLMKKISPLAVLALLAMVLSWSSVPLFLKHFTIFLDAWTVNGVRYVVGTLLLLPVLRGASRANSGRPSLWRSAIIPSVVNSISQIGFALIPYFVTASVLGFGIRTSFLFTLAGSLWLLPEERYLFFSRPFWVGGALCMAGIFALFWGSVQQAAASVPGLLILFGDAAAWGLYGVTVRKYMRGHPPHHSFAAISLYTAGILAVLMLIFGRVSALAEQSAQTLGLLVLSAAIGISLAHVAMYYVLGHLGAIIEGGAEMLTPFLTFCGAAFLFGERLSALQWAGGLGVITGCAIMVSAHGHRSKPALQP
jgi:drug/metabolite transporter (DMT)-like permease